MSYPMPHASVDILEKDEHGRFTGKMAEPWFLFLAQGQNASASTDFGDVMPMRIRIGADDEVLLSIPPSMRVRESGIPSTAPQIIGRRTSDLSDVRAYVPPARRQWSIVELIQDLAANLALYPAAASPSALFIETDTYTVWRSDGAAWAQVTAWDDVYGAGWNGSLKAPTQNAVYDKIEAVIAAAAALISDAVYGAGWDGVTSIAPSKNAVYDKIQTLLSQNGVNFGPAPVASITIVNGQVTAVS